MESNFSQTNIFWQKLKGKENRGNLSLYQSSTPLLQTIQTCFCVLPEHLRFIWKKMWFSRGNENCLFFNLQIRFTEASIQEFHIKIEQVIAIDEIFV